MYSENRRRFHRIFKLEAGADQEIGRSWDDLAFNGTNGYRKSSRGCRSKADGAYPALVRSVRLYHLALPL